MPTGAAKLDDAGNPIPGDEGVCAMAGTYTEQEIILEQYLAERRVVLAPTNDVSPKGQRALYKAAGKREGQSDGAAGCARGGSPPRLGGNGAGCDAEAPSDRQRRSRNLARPEDGRAGGCRCGRPVSSYCL